MKAINFTQPWATVVARGLIHWDTRGASTKYRGDVLIYTPKKKDARTINSDIEWLTMTYDIPLGGLDYGCVIAHATLDDCVEVNQKLLQSLSDREQDWNDWSKRYALCFNNVRAIKPIYTKGAFRLIYDIDINQEELIYV